MEPKTTASPQAESAVVATVPAGQFAELLALTPANLRDIRNMERALHGSDYVVSFYGSVAQNGTLGLASSQINFPFSISEIEAIFESASEYLNVYFLVSADGNNSNSGFNILSTYSPQPYFSGNSTRVKARPNPKEFAAGQYLKVFGINTNSAAAEIINARIRIKVYPLIPQSLS